MILYHTLILNRVLNPKSIYSFNRENIDIGWAIKKRQIILVLGPLIFGTVIGAKTLRKS